MAEQPSGKIGSRKVLTAIEKISEAPVGREFQELCGTFLSIISRFDGTLSAKDQMKYDQYISGLVERTRTEIDGDLSRTILREIYRLFPGNRYAALYSGIELIKSGNLEEGLKMVETSDIWDQSREFLEVVSQSEISDEKVKDIVIKSAYKGNGNPQLWMRFMSSGRDRSEVASVIDAFNRNNYYSGLENFLDVVIGYDLDPFYLLKKAELLKKMDRNDDLLALIRDLNIFSIKEVDQIEAFSDLMLQVGLFNKNLELCRYGLEIYEDVHLIVNLSESYAGMGDLHNAIETCMEILEKYPENYASMIRCARLQFEAGKYKDCAFTFSAVPRSKLSESDFTVMIKSKSYSSMYNEALSDVADLMSFYGKTPENLHLKMDLEMKLHLESDCYYTAGEILELNPDDTAAREFYRSYFFGNQEYEKYLKFLNDDEKSTLMPQVYVALAGTGKFQDSIEVLKKNPACLESPMVWDSIFFKVRTSEQIKKIEELIEISNTNGIEKIRMILRFLKGNYRSPHELNWDDLVVSGSVSLVYINIYSLLKEGRFEEMEQCISSLSENRYGVIRNIVEYNREVRNGKRTGDIVDSMDYLYPATWILILNGIYDEAYAKLNKLETNHPDPFYTYYESLIMEGKGNYEDARKNISHAVEKLENFMFLDLLARVSLRCGKLGDAISAYEIIFKNRGQDSIDFPSLYRILSEIKDHEFVMNFVDLCEYNSLSNIWVKRLKRNIFLDRNDSMSAFEISREIIAVGKLEEADIRTHLSILEKIHPQGDRISFLENVRDDIKDPKIDVLIGDAYFANGHYERALRYYHDAISNGMDRASIQNYPETLINTGNFDEAMEMISGKNLSSLLLVKLYSGKNDIESILRILSNFRVRERDDEEALIFLCRNHWKDPDIRKSLKNIYSNHGFLFLGKEIGVKLIQDGSYDEAMDVLKNLFKNYPENIEVARIYSTLLIKNGDRSEAIRSLSRGLKASKSIEEATEFTNTLLKVYFEDGDYKAVTDLYLSDPSLIDREGLKITVKSYIALDKFEEAERIISRQDKILDHGLNDDLYDELQSRKNFTEILTYVNRLLKLEYKKGRVIDTDEAVYKAEIPIDKIPYIMDFLKGDRYWGAPNPEKYDLISRDVIKRIVKNSGVEKINDIKIFMIYNNLDRKDAVVAVNLYHYIMERISEVRVPKTDDPVILALMKKALKENIPIEPLHMAYMLDIGIGTAMDVVALIGYMFEKKQRESEIQ
ncbi:tetratricopeptide repeat protein [Oxyplasma meridianum]|uniref:Tetratricopeptide repeat protein n=1 Tax=Oxyplasma meridianum TaxID=3073602 RepID=A0AAX4NGL4_9ARCH